MSSIPNAPRTLARINSSGRLGLNLLMLMPLISLTNVWEIASVSGGSIRIIDVLFLLAFLLMVMHILLHGKVRRKVSSFVALTAGFVCISLFGLTFLPDYHPQLFPLLRFLQTLLWGALALFFVRDMRDYRIIARNVILSGVVLASFSIYLFLTKPSLHRIAGFFSSAGGEGLGRQSSFNEIGALYALAALLAICFLIWGRKTYSWSKSIIILAVLILNLGGLVLVQSRSAFLAFAVGSLVLIIPSLTRLFTHCQLSRRIATYALIVLTSGTIIALGVTSLVPTNRIANTFISGSSASVSAAARFDLWSRGIHAWLDSTSHFLLGHGFRSAGQLMETESAHNFFLDVGLSLGVAGLLLMVALLIWPVIKVNTSNTDVVAKYVAIAVLSVAIIVSISGNTLVDPFYGGCTFLLLYGAVTLRAKPE